MNKKNILKVLTITAAIMLRCQVVTSLRQR